MRYKYITHETPVGRADRNDIMQCRRPHAHSAHGLPDLVPRPSVVVRVDEDGVAIRSSLG
jgi:hypothetical protein